MRRLLLLAVVLIGTSLIGHSQGQSGHSFYVQPSVVGAALGNNLNNAPGGSVAVGVTLGGPHTMEADVTWFDTHRGGDSDDKFKFTQLLASYKYEIPGQGNLAFHLGASLGITLEKESFLDVPLRFPAYISDTSANAFTYGAQGDVMYRFNPNVGVVLGLKVLALARTSIVTAGSMSLVSLGLNFRF